MIVMAGSLRPNPHEANGKPPENPNQTPNVWENPIEKGQVSPRPLSSSLPLTQLLLAKQQIRSVMTEEITDSVISGFPERLPRGKQPVNVGCGSRNATP
jgi:hypothetical protein